MRSSTVAPKPFERDYEKNALLQKGFNAEIIADFIKYIHRVCPSAKQRPIKILDLCCGDGGMTTAIFLQLIQSGIKIDKLVGCDISSEQISVATEKYGRINSRLVFQTQDASQITTQNEYDVIISLFGLHWIPNIEHMAQVINTALKANGKLMYFVPLEKNTFFSRRRAMIASAKWAPHFKGFTLAPFISDPNRYSRAFSTLFSAENPNGISGSACVTFSNEHFKRFLSSWMQEIRHLPTHLREAYLNDLLDTLPLEDAAAMNEVERNTDNQAINFYERFHWFHGTAQKETACQQKAEFFTPLRAKL